MAWDSGFAVTAKDDKEKRGGGGVQNVAPAPTAFSTGQTDEQRQQYVAALEAAARLVQVVGRRGDPVKVAITGNANAGFVPGGAAQFVTITVTNTG
jgi:hypothetical protein